MACPICAHFRQAAVGLYYKSRLKLSLQMRLLMRRVHSTNMTTQMVNPGGRRPPRTLAEGGREAGGKGRPADRDCHPS